MQDDLAGSFLFDDLSNWLLDQAQQECSATEIVQGLGRRLVTGGIPVCRISIGALVLHPVFGARDVIWNGDSDTVTSEVLEREQLLRPEVQNAPFSWMAREDMPFYRQRLDQPWEQSFAVFDRLAADNVTDYVAFFRSDRRSRSRSWSALPSGAEGVHGAFSTRRSGGFTEAEIRYLNALSRPLSIAIKIANTTELAAVLLNIYLGQYSGRHVLDGLIKRGDGRLIDCVLWFSDLRRSTAMADEMPLETYLQLLDEYFESTAGAVIAHGGEVLKFIGDAVMAIFPVEEATRARVDMCRAALMAARDALNRIERRNATRGGDGTEFATIRMGVALHIGTVMYGNIGTRQRLDLTATGPAVNEAARLEGLCKRLETPVIVSSAFRAAFPMNLVWLGRHTVDGKDEALEVYTLPEFAPAGRPADSGPSTATDRPGRH